MCYLCMQYFCFFRVFIDYEQRVCLYKQQVHSTSICAFQTFGESTRQNDIKFQSQYFLSLSLIHTPPLYMSLVYVCCRLDQRMICVLYTVRQQSVLSVVALLFRCFLIFFFCCVTCMSSPSCLLLLLAYQCKRWKRWRISLCWL